MGRNADAGEPQEEETGDDTGSFNANEDEERLREEGEGEGEEEEEEKDDEEETSWRQEEAFQAWTEEVADRLTHLQQFELCDPAQDVLWLTPNFVVVGTASDKSRELHCLGITMEDDPVRHRLWAGFLGDIPPFSVSCFFLCSFMMTRRIST